MFWHESLWKGEKMAGAAVCQVCLFCVRDCVIIRHNILLYYYNLFQLLLWRIINYLGVTIIFISIYFRPESYFKNIRNILWKVNCVLCKHLIIGKLCIYALLYEMQNMYCTT